MDPMSRRNVLTAAAAGSLVTAGRGGAQAGESMPQPLRPGAGGINPGPKNLTRAGRTPI